MNAHPIGVAVLQTPFFLIAHALTKWSNLSPDGFTLYYQHAAGLAGTFWTVAGLFVMRALLRRFVTDRIAAVTLLTMLFGTNLYHYATFDSTYSHPYSFFLLASLLFLTDRWTRADGADMRDAVLLGIVSGLIVLTRHTNVLFLLVLPLYGVTDGSTARDAMLRLTGRGREVAIIAVVALATCVPQLAVYYRATGHVFVNSYGDLGFTFLTPHLWGVLFSVTKGVFFWSPVLLAGVAGYALQRHVTRPFALAAGIIFVIDTYLIASWWDWQFGGSYGHRGFVDLLPFFGLGLAAFFEWSAERLTRQHVVAIATVALVGLSCVQMLQYWNGVIPVSDMTWAQYRSVFLRLR